MKEIKFLQPTKSGKALDIGSYDGRNFPPLLEMGYQIDAIEIREDMCEQIRGQYPFVNLFEGDAASFEYKENEYDVILCHNVFPFMGSNLAVVDVIEKSIKALKPGGLFWFTLFGDNDGWAENINTYDFESMKQQLMGDDRVDLIFSSTEDGLGAAMNGDVKNWHIHGYLVRKKS